MGWSSKQSLLSDSHLGVIFVTFSGVVGDLHLGDQKVTWKKLGQGIFMGKES